MNLRTLALLALPLAACKGDPGDTDTTDATDATDAAGTADTAETSEQVTTDMSGSTGGEYVPPPLSDACDFGPDEAAALALVTNDFVAPAALHRVDALANTIVEIAPATTDTALGADADHLVMVHRLGFNRIDVFDRGADWAARGSVDVVHEGADDPNPQGVVFAGDGLAYVPLFAAPAVQIYDFDQDPAAWKVGSIDLSSFADDDGSPEAGAALACGRVLFVAIQRLVDFAPVGGSALVALDLDARAVFDLDAAAGGDQALPLLGLYPKQFRRDPADPTGHTALVLTSGIERVDLAAGTTTWAVTPEALAAAGIEGFDLQAFALGLDGASALVAATDGDWPASAVFRVGLDGAAPQTPEKLVSGLTSGDRMLEVLGGFLYVGDANPADPRVRVWDLTQAPPVEVAAEGLKTAVPPWTFLPLR